MFRKLRRLAEIHPADWIGFLLLVLLLISVRVALRFVTLQRVVAVLPGFRRFPVFPAGHPPSRLVALANLAARVTFGRDRCLGRSILLLWLLRARGEPAELLVGVNREERRFQSHAWIQVRDQIVADIPEKVGRFAFILRLP
jgi:hypothetical protein